MSNNEQDVTAIIQFVLYCCQDAVSIQNVRLAVHRWNMLKPTAHKIETEAIEIFKETTESKSLNFSFKSLNVEFLF